MTIDREYFRTCYEDSVLAERNSTLVGFNLGVGSDILDSFCDLLAYKVSEVVKYETLVSPDVGARELGRNLSRLNVFSTILGESVLEIRPVDRTELATAIRFLLYAGFLFFEVDYARRSELNMHNLMHSLESVRQPRDLEYIIRDYNLFVASPLLYTRLGEDILSVAGVSVAELYRPQIVGMMLELYVKCSHIQGGRGLDFHTYKYGRAISREVDLIDFGRGILCELSVSDKRLRDVNLRDTFPDMNFIRVLATKTHSDTVGGIFRVPYPKLCTMFDLGTVYGLGRSRCSSGSSGYLSEF
jgi:hypothetical protein